MARCNLDALPVQCDCDCGCEGLSCFTGTIAVTSSGGTVSGTLTTRSGFFISIRQTRALCGPSLLSVNGLRASLCGTSVRVNGSSVLDVTTVLVSAASALL